jgi:uncharacterized protein (DUF983 family)
MNPKLSAAMRLLCPNCGRAKLFSGWFRMKRCCDACGLVYQREAGYFVGALYVNYGATVLLTVILWLVLELGVGVAWGRILPVLIVFAALFPLWFFRYSRAIWIAVDLLMDPPRPRDYEQV